MSSWILILFQMLLPKFVRRLCLSLLLKPLLLLKPPAAAETLAAVEAPAAAEAPAADVSLPTRSRDEASPEFTKEIELTVQRGKDPVQRAPLLEVREVVPED
jgi:hypothetical protein